MHQFEYIVKGTHSHLNCEQWIPVGIDQLLSGDSVNSDCSGQWLSKHVAIARQQIRIDAAVGPQQWERGVSSVVDADVLYNQNSLEHDFSCETVASRQWCERVKLRNLHCYQPLPGNGW
jgi:hypothetical protein